MSLADTAALIASLELEDKFSKTLGAYERGIGNAERQTSTLGRVGNEASRGLSNVGSNLRTIGTIAAGFAVTGLVLSVRAASDLAESQSKVNVVFGDGAQAVEDWASSAATAFGTSTQQALEAAGTFGNLLQAFGLGQKPAQDMSQRLVELAADLASFNNTSPEEALDALRSGLTGEAEPLKRYGVAINDVRLKQKALALGLITSTKDALTPGIKAQAAYALILDDTALAQGDFARTSDGLANQQRIIRAQLTNTAATIGTALIPAITTLAGKFSTFISENQPAIEAFAAQLPAAFDSLLEVAGNLPWSAIGDAFKLMGTGSKALLDAFVGLPPWVQTAVLTGWGLNKLSGGALSNILGTLASGLIKGVLGINAGVVNVRAATVTGAGGGAVAGGAAGGAAGIVKTLAAVGVFTAVATAIGEVVAQNVTRPLNPGTFDFNAVAGASGRFTTQAGAEDFARDLASQLGVPLDTVKAGIVSAVVDNGLTFTQAVDRLKAAYGTSAASIAGAVRHHEQSGTRDTSKVVGTSAQVRAAVGQVNSSVVTGEAGRRAQAARQQSDAAALLQTQAQALRSLQTIAAKAGGTVIKVNQTTNVAISGRTTQALITQAQLKVGTGPQEF